MPKYSEDKVFNHYLYFTSHCIVEAMHVHAGNEELSEESSAKFFVRADGAVRPQTAVRIPDFYKSTVGAEHRAAWDNGALGDRALPIAPYR